MGLEPCRLTICWSNMSQDSLWWSSKKANYGCFPQGKNNFLRKNTWNFSKDRLRETPHSKRRLPALGLPYPWTSDPPEPGVGVPIRGRIWMTCGGDVLVVYVSLHGSSWGNRWAWEVWLGSNQDLQDAKPAGGWGTGRWARQCGMVNGREWCEGVAEC